MNQISLSIQSIFNGIKGIGKYNFMRYIFLSGLIAVVVFIVLGIFSWILGGFIGDALVNLIPWVGDRDGQSGKWAGRILSLGLGIILFKYIILIATGPLMSKVSERIEKVHAPDLEHLGLNFAQSLNRGVKFSVRSLFFEMIYTILISLLGFIPFVNIISVPLIFIVQAYFAGAGNMDLTLERFYKISGSTRFIRKHFILAIVFGSIFLFILFIPIIGLFIAPVFGTAISSYGVLDILKSKEIDIP